MLKHVFHSCKLATVFRDMPKLGSQKMRCYKVVAVHVKINQQTLAARILFPRYATKKNPDWIPSCCKIRRIWGTSFNTFGCTTLWALALERPILRRKKGFANISLGLNYCSMGLSRQPSRDTVPSNRFGFSRLSEFSFFIKVFSKQICNDAHFFLWKIFCVCIMSKFEMMNHKTKTKRLFTKRRKDKTSTTTQRW
jgi:hypothetical protein